MDWIRTADRMFHDSDRDVLLFDAATGRMKVGSYDREYTRFRHSEGHVFCVTHWTELPETPFTAARSEGG